MLSYLFSFSNLALIFTGFYKLWEVVPPTAFFLLLTAWIIAFICDFSVIEYDE